MKKISWNIFSTYRSALMCVCIIGILFCHMLTNSAEHGITDVNSFYGIAMFGSSFVDAFLFLSGIGLFYSFSHNSDLKSFYKRRFLKLFISYFIVAIPTITFICIKAEQGFADFLLNITGISLFISGKTFAWYIITITTLYLLFPLFYKVIFQSKNELASTFVISFLEIALALSLKLVTPDFFNNIDIAIERFPIFVLGIYCGKLCKTNKFIKNSRLILLIAVGVIAFLLRVTGNTPGTLVYYSNSVIGFTSILVSALILKFFDKRNCKKMIKYMSTGGVYA